MNTCLHGIRLVAVHEFRMRLRTGRWKWLLGGFTLTMLAFTWFLDSSLKRSRDMSNSSIYNVATGSYQSIPDRTPVGPQMFGILMLFVLGLMLIISPTLTSQSVNGDRERGTLATLQVTLLSPAQIAIGKLLAGWSVGLVALGLSVPFVAWSLIEGGVGVLNAVVTLTVVALLFGVVCAVAQALSALTSRSISSSLLSYLVTAALTIGTPIAYTLGVSLTQETRTHTYQDVTYTDTVTHREEVWWLLSPNPFVVLGDAAPALPPLRDSAGNIVSRSEDPLGGIRRSVRDATRPEPVGQCVPMGRPSMPGVPDPQPCTAPKEPAPVWPWGLAFDLMLGAGALLVTIQRLRTPATRLGRGVRVA